MIKSIPLKDIKLEADVSAERLIKAILNKESIYPILAEESGKSVDDLSVYVNDNSN